MGQNKQSFSIDLTEDDTDLMDQLQSPAPYDNVITQKNNIHLEKKQTYSPLPVPDVSTVHYLETLQKENPQIETVFIDSDDDKTKNLRHQITLHDMVIINPFEGSKSIPQTNVNVIPDNKNANSIQNQTSSHSTNETTPLRVRPIAPSELNPIFMENSSTIALQDASDKSSRKFLVIPKDLVPILAASLGPITLNIPGIGPINIPKSLVKTQSASIPVGEQKFLQEQKSRKIVFQSSPKQTIYDPLTDPKYCWRYIRARKRDLDGFSLTDRLGFYKAEQHRSRACAAKYNEILHKMQLSIDSKKNVVKAFNQINMSKFKLSENKRIQPQNTVSLLKKKCRSGPRSAHKKNETNFLNKTHRQIISSDSDNSISDNDLLVTKKVVFINEKERRRGKKRKKHYKPVGNQHDLSNTNMNNFEELIPKRGRPKKLDKVEKNSAYQVKSKLLQSKSKRRCQQQKTEFNMKSLPSINPKRKQKLLDIKSKNQGIFKLKPCHVPIDYDESVQKALIEYNEYTSQCIKKLNDTCEIINNLKQFQTEIQPTKPLLVINQEHCHKMNFQDLYSKYNVVFPLFENVGFANLTITNSMFLEFAKKGYIKFVKPNILCKYLAGFREV